MIIIADTAPVNYLILIECVDVLAELYGPVLIPQAVFDELQSGDTPEAVRVWVAHSPEWLQVRPVNAEPDDALKRLGAGGREAIAMAVQLSADAIIIDERDGRQEAVRRNLRVIGTLRVLSDAAELGLLDLAEAIGRLRQTSFRASDELYQRFLDLDAERKGSSSS